MSHFATPLIVVNLGCEMVFVIDQRLKAQAIGPDKSERVLMDIVTVMLHQKLLDELFTPQPVAPHAVIKQLLRDISTTSIMKLDDYSMNKLWDLMTMIYKWQISVATNQNLFDITRKHLRSVHKLLPEYFPKLYIERAMNRFDSLAQQFTDNDYKCLHNTMILWFSEYHMKISVLLRLGLQRKDGTFNLPATIDAKVLHNLGENIYNYDTKRNPVDDYVSRCSDTNEINCLCLLTPAENVSKQTVVELQLPVELGNGDSKNKTLQIARDTQFESINTSIKVSKGTDLTFNLDVTKSPHEDLLDMLADN